MLAMPQLSELPLFTLAAVTETHPEVGVTVTSWQRADGAAQSVMVTVALQLLVLPRPSETVSVTAFTPRLVQPNEPCDRVMLVMPQLSELPLLISEASAVA